MTGRDERGSATVAGLAMLGVLLTVTLVSAGVGGLFVAHRQAQSAADLGSLAAASAIQRGEAPCPAAAAVAERNGGQLSGCRVQGEVVTVRVSVASVPLLGRVRHTEASARAGPATTDGNVRPW